MASKRKTPELKLNEEEPLVLSRDFNLFYRPQEKPLPAGTENFIKSLDNFITGAGASMVIASEYKHTIPVYERNTNLSFHLKSSHPSPATLHSMTWEGDYNSRYYRRV